MTDGKQVPLLTLLVEIAPDQNRPLNLVEFVWLVHGAGYRTDALSFPNLVMQALKKLVKQGIFGRDDDWQYYVITSSTTSAHGVW